MSYRVRTESFEGPFDLLLYLVSRQRVAIGAISITAIADQYLAEVARMETLDLDVASDFLVVASTLLEIKAASLLPKPVDATVEDLEELSPNEAREILIERLLLYKQYKNAAAALSARHEAEGRMHARPFGPDPQFLGLLPDFLRDVSLDALAYLCEQAFARRERALLESEHIAAKPIPVETHVRAIHARVRNEKRLKFSDLAGEGTPTPVVVVSFLAILELYKRSMVRLTQDETFGDIRIDYIEGSGELFLEGDDAVTSDDPNAELATGNAKETAEAAQAGGDAVGGDMKPGEDASRETEADAGAARGESKAAYSSVHAHDGSQGD